MFLLFNSSTQTQSNLQVRLWFSLSLTLSIICGILALSKTWGQEYIIQDDARSHVVWMFRFLDPELFPNDIIIDYFQSVAPIGYAKFYQLFAVLGVHPLLLNQLLPTLLAIITTAFCFGVCLELFPVPFAGFLAALFLNQNLWLKDDLITATPRAFFYPLFLAFVYFLLRRSVISVGITIALLGGFYPQGVLIAIGVLIIQTLGLKYRQNLLQTKDSIFLFTGLGVGLIVLVPYAIQTSEWGSIITLAEAQELPEFYPGGRASFFTDKPWDFWLTGDRSGWLPQDWFRRSFPPQVFAGIALPFLLKYRTRFPGVEKIKPSIILLPEIILASTGLFLAAHFLLFKLHHPSRYSQHSFRIVMAIAGGIAVTIILDTILRKIKWKTANFGVKLILILLTFLALCYPSLTNRFPITNNIVGKVPLLYEFFAIQPQDTLIASLAEEANNLPTFSQRSILVGSEYLLPYHQKYYAQMQQRTQDLIQAQYSSNPEEVKRLIQTYNINFWMLEKDALTLEFVENNQKLQQLNSKIVSQVQDNLKQGKIPFLSNVIENCTVLEVQNFTILDAPCIFESEKLNQS